jgi:hypothetical protein
MEIETVEEFEKDIKKLEKFRTIREDIEVFKKAIKIDPRRLAGAVRVSYTAQGVKINPEVEVYKARKFRCKYLKGKGSLSGIRVIYGFWPKQNKIILLEIYYEEKKKRDCDFTRLKQYFGI